MRSRDVQDKPDADGRLGDDGYFASAAALVDLRADSTVGIIIGDGGLLVKPNPAKRYRLQNLIDQCDPEAPMPPRDEAWLNAPAIVSEVL